MNLDSSTTAPQILCWISPAVTFCPIFLYTNMFKGNLIHRIAHRIIKYLKLKWINLNIKLKEPVLDRVIFRNKALLKQTLMVDDEKQNLN